MAFNSTQKINRARKARGLAPWGHDELKAHYAARTGAATMRATVFALIFDASTFLNMTRADRIEGARKVREHFDTASVFVAAERRAA